VPGSVVDPCLLLRLGGDGREHALHMLHPQPLQRDRPQVRDQVLPKVAGVHAAGPGRQIRLVRQPGRQPLLHGGAVRQRLPGGYLPAHRVVVRQPPHVGYVPSDPRGDVHLQLPRRLDADRDPVGNRQQVPDRRQLLLGPSPGVNPAPRHRLPTAACDLEPGLEMP